VAVRIAIVVLAVGAVVVLATRLRDHDRCEGARANVAARIATLEQACRDPDVVAGASAALVAAGQRDRGLALARESVRREPRSFIAQVALALALRDRDPAAAQRAVARAKALNPRWPGLAPAPAPQSP
jgi:hypothetical protein